MAERYEQRGYYGASETRGTSWTSVVIGWLTALGAGVILSGIISGVVALFAGAAGGSTARAGTVGGVGLLITLFLAFLVGGYTAGRLAGRSGAKHGLLVALLALVITLVLVLASGVVGAALIDNLRGITLPGVPQDVAQSGLNTVFTLYSILALLLPFVAGALGGSHGASTGARRP